MKTWTAEILTAAFRFTDHRCDLLIRQTDRCRRKSVLLPAIGVMIGTLLFAAEVIPNSQAQTLSEGQRAMNMFSDRLIFDESKNQISAVGHVEIHANGWSIETDRAILEMDTGRLSVPGSVRINDPSGSDYQASSISSNGDLSHIVAHALEGKTHSQLYITARSADIRQHQASSTLLAKWTSITTCLPCEADPKASPAWKITSRSFRLDRENRRLYHNGALLWMFGAPVFGLPRISHPTPGSESSTGFLVPRVSFEEPHGVYIQTPYFLSFSPSADVTISPSYSFRQGPAIELEARHHINGGAYAIRAAAAQLGQPDFFPSTPRESFRYILQSDGRIRLSEHINLSWEGSASSDLRFATDYPLMAPIQTPRVALSYSTTNQFADIELRYHPRWAGKFSNRRHAFVRPAARWLGVGPADPTWGQIEWAAAFKSLSRETRFVKTDPGKQKGGLACDPVRGKWDACALMAPEGIQNELKGSFTWRHRLLEANSGILFEPFASISGSYRHFHVETEDKPFPHQIADKIRDPEFSSAGIVGAELSWPWLIHAGDSRMIFAPTVRASWTSAHSINRLPEFLSLRRPELTATTLFEIPTALPAFDQTSALQISTLIPIHWQLAESLSIRTIVGRNVRYVPGPVPSDPGQSDGDRFVGSDWVLHAQLDVGKILNFEIDTIIDSDTFSMRQVGIGAELDFGRFSGNFAFETRNTAIGNTQTQINTSSQINLSDTLSIMGQVTYDLEFGKMLTNQLSLRYQDDCADLSLNYKTTFPMTEVSDPEHVWSLSVRLDPIGDTLIKYEVPRSPLF